MLINAYDAMEDDMAEGYNSQYGNTDYDDENYCPSSTNGDYSPSNPWDAPGMSMSDFI